MGIHSFIGLTRLRGAPEGCASREPAWGDPKTLIRRNLNVFVTFPIKYCEMQLMVSAQLFVQFLHVGN
jgi:hypothetical protein